MTLRRMVLVAINLLFVICGMSLSAQTVDVIAEASTGFAVAGQQVTINVDVEVSNPNHEVLPTTGVNAICTAPGSPDLSIAISNLEAGSVMAASYQYAGEGSLTAGSQLGLVAVNCTATAIFNGNSTSFTGSGSTSFTIVQCAGDSDTSEQDTSSGSFIDATWKLTAINLTPSNLVPATGSASNTGITGVLPSELINDCDNGTNDNIQQVPPTIEDAGEEDDGNTIIFSFVTQGWGYTSDPCNSCDANPLGVENPQPLQKVPLTASLTQSCTAPQ